MATFPDIEPSFSVKKQSQPITRTVVFGDGYEHRLGFGVPSHLNPRQYSLTWQNITEDQADTIEYFLNERALDKASFDYAPPKENFTKTGTYAQSSTTITITMTDHRLFAGDSIVVDFTSGTSADGTYIVSSITNANTFVITASASATTNGNVSVTKTGTAKFICPKWSKRIDVPTLATIDATFIEKFEP